MADARARNGRIVVRKPGTTDYGVELAAPADAARLQVRLVGSDRPASPRDARRDADQVTVWCSNFGRLKAELAGSGDELVVETALPPGAQPLRSVAADVVQAEHAADRRSEAPRRRPLSGRR